MWVWQRLTLGTKTRRWKVKAWNKSSRADKNQTEQVRLYPYHAKQALSPALLGTRRPLEITRGLDRTAWLTGKVETSGSAASFCLFNNDIARFFCALAERTRRAGRRFRLPRWRPRPLRLLDACARVMWALRQDRLPPYPALRVLSESPSHPRLLSCLFLPLSFCLGQGSVSVQFTEVRAWLYSRQ